MALEDGGKDSKGGGSDVAGGVTTGLATTGGAIGGGRLNVRRGFSMTCVLPSLRSRGLVF